MKLPLRHLALVCFLILLGSQASAQGLFNADHVLALTLETDLTALLNDIGEEREEHRATLSYQSAEGASVSVPLKVKTRGNYRRNPEHCAFPPLRLNFSKKDTTQTLFLGQDKIKLVTHCQSEHSAYEQYILQEYLIYKTYNILTEKSFRVRLVLMTYVDKLRRQEPLTRYAFLIEDEDQMAARQDAILSEQQNVPAEELDYDQISLLYLFEYMIGNIDWDVEMLQNVKLIGPEEGKSLVAVPYDFDFAGVINPAYDTPVPSLGINTLRTRLFTDFCRSEKELGPVLAHFNTHKAAIYALYEEAEFLDDANRKRALRHYDRFFRTINDPQSVDREFIRPCRVKS